jgi:glycosyltransferase involved in cell wall biosynthesis
MQPKVSVLMCVYNGEKFLREAIDSILAQTFTDFEFVIVNDGSKDASAEILTSYNDPRLKILNIENRGLPAALNYGLKHCTTDLVMRMDADDVAYSHRFAALLEDWEKAGQPDVFGSGVDYINEDGKELWSFSVPLEDAAIKAAILAPNGVLAVIHPSTLLRKESVLACGAYDSLFKNGQDYDLWLRMTTNYSFGNSPRRLLRYRFQSQSDTAMAIRCKLGDIRIGNYMKLLSRQKKIMIDAGVEDIWHSYQDTILNELQRRTKLSSLMAESIALRRLTEIKILFYCGKKTQGSIELLNLFVRFPETIIKRFMGRKMTDVTKYLLNIEEVKQLVSKS